MPNTRSYMYLFSSVGRQSGLLAGLSLVFLYLAAPVAARDRLPADARVGASTRPPAGDVSGTSERRPPTLRSTDPCNGYEHLCDRSFDQVAYVTTHNAFNYAYGPNQYWFPNQQTSIPRQLEDGVRGLMIDVHEYNGFDQAYAGQTFVCHSYCNLGGEPLVDILATIADFLAQNPREVVTIIFESYVSVERMEEAFVESGLIEYVHPQDVLEPWPTLGEMIETGERLVVFTDREGGQRDWYLDVWDFAVETPYSAKTRDDLGCEYNRGDPDNSLFIFNHFLTWPIARRSLAAEVNYNPFLAERAYNCWSALGKMPNFVTVDFYLIGDVKETVDLLNGVIPD